MTKVFVRGPGRVVVRADVGDQHVVLTWDSVDVIVRNPEDGKDVTLTLKQPKELKPVATDAIRLADAVYAGDETAALALADEVQLQRTSGSEYVHRDELLSLLRQIEWRTHFSAGCPCCGLQRDAPDFTHRLGCRLGKALGRPCVVSDEPDDHADDYAEDDDADSFPFL